ncbi:MAG: hypothetical protein JRH20_18650 [Deltaproteobacteria bacterium]|nr:hypothetical protein [Deltaproteobacteria bacterium]
MTRYRGIRLVACSVVPFLLSLACNSRPTSPEDSAVDRASSSDVSLDLIQNRDLLHTKDLPKRHDAHTDGTEFPRCNPALVECRALPPYCHVGMIASVEDACWGPCVEVATCSDLPEHPNCDLRNVSCEMMEPICPDGYFPTAEGYCYGACVPSGACWCDCGPGTSPKECCPVPGFTCWTVGFCGPLI